MSHCWRFPSPRGGGGRSVVLRFQPGAISFPELDQGSGHTFLAQLPDAAIPSGQLRQGLAQLPALSIRPVAPAYRHLQPPFFDYEGNEIDLVDMTDDYWFDFTSDMSDDAILQSLASLPGVAHAEIPKAATFQDYDPGDEYYPRQWYLNNPGGSFPIQLAYPCLIEASDCEPDIDINAPEAWSIALGPGTKVGVLDEGVLAGHEDLLPYLSLGAIDPNLSRYEHVCRHGTGICGIISAYGSNTYGIAGIANAGPVSQEFTIVFWEVDAANCVHEVDPQKAHTALQTLAIDPEYYPQVLVVNESWGQQLAKWGYDTISRDVHRNAYARGLTVVAGAGNASFSPEFAFYPAAFDNLVLAVTGVDCRGANHYAREFWNDLAAPADALLTTHANDRDPTTTNLYDGVSPIGAQCGTSFATPIVSAVAALLYGQNPGIDVDGVRHVLTKTAKDLGPEGYDPDFGYGLVRADTALAYVSAPRQIRHAQAGPTSHVYETFRQIHVRNVKGANPYETWWPVWARQYRLTGHVTLNLGPNETAIDAWARPRLSTGAAVADSIDGKLQVSNLEIEGFDGSGCDLVTRTYKLFANADTTGCLGWYPVAIASEGSCGPTTPPIRLSCSYVVESGTKRLPERPPETAAITAKPTGNGIELTLRGAGDHEAEAMLFSVDGRLRATGTLHGVGGNTLSGLVGGVGERMQSGIYFVDVHRSGKPVVRHRIVVVQ